MKVRAFITHKKAETFKDCQDRFSVNPDTKSIAVSDGMSQSVFQKIWAEMLVKKYTDFGDWVPNIESIKELSPEWLRKVEEFIKIEEEKGNNPWRAKNSIYAEHRSAGATILGIRFNQQEWTCDVLGDSCLVVVEENNVKEIISSSDSGTFDNYPDYYDSDSNKPSKGILKTKQGELSKTESLLLVSDPFSDFLSKHREDEELIKQIFALNSHQEFETLVENWRNEGMHNDDSTMVIVEYDGKDEFNLADIDEIDKLIETDCEEIKEKSVESTIDEPNGLKNNESLKSDLKGFLQRISKEDIIGKRKRSKKDKSSRKKKVEFIDKLCDELIEIFQKHI